MRLTGVPAITAHIKSAHGATVHISTDPWPYIVVSKRQALKLIASMEHTDISATVAGRSIFIEAREQCFGP